MKTNNTLLYYINFCTRMPMCCWVHVCNEYKRNMYFSFVKEKTEVLPRLTIIVYQSIWKRYTVNLYIWGRREFLSNFNKSLIDNYLKYKNNFLNNLGKHIFVVSEVTRFSCWNLPFVKLLPNTFGEAFSSNLRFRMMPWLQGCNTHVALAGKSTNFTDINLASAESNQLFAVASLLRRRRRH